MFEALKAHGIKIIHIGSKIIELPETEKIEQAELRKRGGGSITIKLGDRIRWYMVDGDDTDWLQEGVVISISKDDDKGITLLLRDTKDREWSVLSEGDDWYREYEIIRE